MSLFQPEVNSITFPGGILHAPFYDYNYPAAINYGGLGVIAGRDLFSCHQKVKMSA